jgi:hypothetical protein
MALMSSRQACGADVAAGQVQRVHKAGSRDDGGSMLVVVEYWYVHQLPQALLDDEAVGCLDVLEIDAAEGGPEIAHAVDEGVDLAGVDLEVDRVDIGKALEEDGLALHDGLGGEGAEVPQTKDRRAVGDHGHEIPAGGVVINCGWIVRDGAHRHRNPRRIGEAQVALRRHRLGWPYFNLARLGVGVKEKRFLVGEWSLFRHVSTSVLNRTRTSDFPGSAFPCRPQ